MAHASASASALVTLHSQVADFYGNAFPDAAADADTALDGSNSHAGGGMSVLVAAAQVMRTAHLEWNL